MRSSVPSGSSPSTTSSRARILCSSGPSSILPKRVSMISQLRARFRSSRMRTILGLLSLPDFPNAFSVVSL
eukprot:3913287-Pyramimonas_sp.AAC.1